MRTVIFDIDGVVIDSTDRLDILRTGRGEPGYLPDWDTYYRNSHMDVPYPDMVRRCISIDDDVLVWMVFLTNRPESNRHDTALQLYSHGLYFDELIMRPDGVEYEAFKGLVLDEMLHYGYNITEAYDDDPYHKDVYESRGVPLIYVPSGYYDEVRITETGAIASVQ